MKKKPKTKYDKRKILRYALRTLLVTLVSLAIGILTGIGALYLVVFGPSESARNNFIRTLEETSRGPMIARLFLSDGEIEKITAGMHKDTEENIDKNLIHIPSEADRPGQDSDGNDYLPIRDPETSSDAASPEVPSDNKNDDGLELIRISGGAYKGALLIVEDPKRVFVGTHDRYGTGRPGLEVDEFIERYNATAGMNAGGFEDGGGQGNGGNPTGLVISGGKIVWGSKYSTYSICGFDDEGILYVGQMTGAKALAKGVTSACSFGPALIMNGVPLNKRSAFNSGRNPRTAIGQRADGAILMLTIEGRQVDSLGATYDELVEILYSYGAVNATNLDGGSSTIMYLNGEQVIRSSTIASSSRGGATAIIVK